MKKARSFLTNLATLLLALGLAVFIWANAAQTQDPIGSRFLEAPVQLVGQPDGTVLITSDDSPFVQIRLEGPESLIQEVVPEDLTATVDLSQVPSGVETTVPIKVTGGRPGVSISFFVPEEVTVLLEEQVTRQIPVELDLRGSVARGHTQGEPLTDPPVVTVSGPASRVNALDFALLTVFLNNARETTTESSVPIFYDNQGRVASVTGLELDTNEVLVTIPVEESAGFADKLITVVWSGEPAPGYRLLSVSADPPSILVEGLPAQVNQLTNVQTEPIDITGLTESFRQQVVLDLPEGIAVDPEQSITVNIEIGPILTTGTYNRVPETLGLREGLEAILAPEQVRVVLFGPLAVLDSLQESDVRVTLDLFGLEPGLYTVEPDVDVPDRGIEVRSVQPSTVNVVITPTITTTLGITETLTPTETPLPAAAAEPTPEPVGTAVGDYAFCLLLPVERISVRLREICLGSQQLP